MKFAHLLSISHLKLLLSGLFIVCGMFYQANAQTKPKSFVRLVSSDETNRYFEVDLRQLPSFFEKAYFLDNTFRDTVVVVQNSSLKNNFLPLLCHTKLETEKVLLHIQDLKDKVVKASISMSESEKAIMIKKFEKYR